MLQTLQPSTENKECVYNINEGYQPVITFEDIVDYQLRQGLGTSLEFLISQQAARQLQEITLDSVWIQDAREENAYFVSLDLGACVRTSVQKIIRRGQTVQICFSPMSEDRQEHGPHQQTGEVVWNDEVDHGGTHLLYVRLRQGHQVCTCKSWDSDAVRTKVYLKVQLPHTTYKNHLKAITSLTRSASGSDVKDSDEDKYTTARMLAHQQDAYEIVRKQEPRATSVNQDEVFNGLKNQETKVDFKELLLGENCSSITDIDYTRGLQPEEINNGLATLTVAQRTDLLACTRRIPNGLLLTTGGPLSGKTTVLVALVELRLKAGDVVDGFATSNATVNNYFNYTRSSTGAQRKLLVRLFPLNMKTEWLEEADLSNVNQMLLDSQSDDGKYIFNGSAAHTILQVANLCETDNRTLLDMHARHPELIAHFKYPAHSQERRRIDRKELYRKVMLDIMSHAVMLFCTTAVAGERFAEEFKLRCKLVTLDEAGGSQESEVLVIWDRKSPLILSRNIKQRPLPSLLEPVKDENKNWMNPLSPQLTWSLPWRLYEVGWA
jgi:hypothetical protein